MKEDSSKLLKIRFNGSQFDKHLININDLAPSLLSIADICTATNQILNQNKAGLKIFVKANIEQHCFEIGIQIVQSIYEQIRGLLGKEEVKDIKQILEWAGIIIGTTTGTAIGFIKLAKLIANKKIKSTEFKKESGRDVVIIHVEGSNNSITVDKKVYSILGNKKALKGVKTLAESIDKEGCDNVEFEYENKINTISKEDAGELKKIDYDEMQEQEPTQSITGHIYVFQPTFDDKAKRWKFKYNLSTESIDISESNIAELILSRGKVVIGDCFKVKMEVIEKKTEKGYKNDYKVIEVLEFIEGSEQTSFTFE